MASLGGDSGGVSSGDLVDHIHANLDDPPEPTVCIWCNAPMYWLGRAWTLAPPGKLERLTGFYKLMERYGPKS